MKLNLLTSATGVDDAIRFVCEIIIYSRNEDVKEPKEPDYKDKDNLVEKQQDEESSIITIKSSRNELNDIIYLEHIVGDTWFCNK